MRTFIASPIACDRDDERLSGRGHRASAPVDIELSYSSEIFGRRRDELDAPWYDLALGAIEPGLMTSLGGFALAVLHGLALFDAADAIIIPSWKSGLSRRHSSICSTPAYRREARIVSMCTDALLLAHARLLEGRALPRIGFTPTLRLAKRCPQSAELFRPLHL